LTEDITDSAISFIEWHHEDRFLLVISHWAVHVPIQSPSELVEKYSEKTAAGVADSVQRNAVYAGMIEHLDSNIGRFLDALDGMGLSERTLVVLLSDNGGLASPEPMGIGGSMPHTPATNLTPLRQGKGFLYEGGIRIRWMVRWPGMIAAGSESDVPIITNDLLATLIDAAAVPDVPSHDGLSLVPLLRDTSAALDRDGLYWHYPHYSNQGGRPGSAIRAGRLKLIERHEDGALELFDLSTDPEETRNLASTRPGEAAALQARLAAWQRDVGAKQPTRRR